jgi:hypothetical protein
MKVSRGQTVFLCGVVAIVTLLCRPALAAATDDEAPVVTRTIEPVEPAPIVPEEALRLDEGTAYMVGRHKLKLGLLAFEYGIIQKLSIGTDPPAWAVRAIARVWVPNLHVKYQFYDRGRVAVAGLLAGYVADISKNGSSGVVLTVPATALVSVICNRYLILHPSANYIFARAVGSGDVTSTTIHGAAAARAAQVALMAQFPITHIFSLLAVGQVQVYTADVGVSGTKQVDAYTTASVDATVVPAHQHPWQAVAGAAFLWKYFHLTAGAGYGYYFVPGLQVAVPKQTVVPYLSAEVVL